MFISRDLCQDREELKVAQPEEIFVIEPSAKPVKN